MRGKALGAIIGGVAVAVVIGLVVYFAQQSAPTDDYIVKIGYVEGIFNLPNWVAQDQGMFAKNGVQVELIKFQSSNDLATAVLNNQVDIAGIMATEVILSVEEKQSDSLAVFYCFTPDTDTPVTNIVVSKNSTITSIDEIRTMAVFPGSMPPILNKIVQEKANSSAQMTLLPLAPPLQLQALASGQVDAVTTFLPFDVIAQENGIGRVLVPAVWETYVSNPFTGSCMSFSSAFVEEHPELASGVFASIDEASLFIENNQSEAKKVITSHLPIDENIADKIKIPKWKKAADVKEPLQNFIDALYNAGELKNRISPDDIVYRG